MNLVPTHARPIRRAAALSVTAATLLGAGAVGLAPAADAEVEGRARGYDLRCSARLDGQPVQVAVHDVDRGFEFAQVTIGRGDREVTGFTDAGGAVTHRQVLVTTDVDGDPVVLIGSVRRSGDPQRVATRSQDGLGAYVTRGTRTPVRTRLEIRWRGVTAPVSCRWASAFDTTTTAQQ